MVRPDGEVSAHFVKSPWFLIETFDAEKEQVIKREFIENPYLNEARKKGLLVGNWLLSLKPDEVIVTDSTHQGTAVVLLREAGVEVRTAA